MLVAEEAYSIFEKFKWTEIMRKMIKRPSIFGVAAASFKQKGEKRISKTLTERYRDLFLDKPGLRIIHSMATCFKLTRRFPTASYASVPTGAKFAHFGLCEEIVWDREIVEYRGLCQNVGPPFFFH